MLKQEKFIPLVVALYFVTPVVTRGVTIRILKQKMRLLLSKERNQLANLNNRIPINAEKFFCTFTEKRHKINKAKLIQNLASECCKRSSVNFCYSQQRAMYYKSIFITITSKLVKKKYCASM